MKIFKVWRISLVLASLFYSSHLLAAKCEFNVKNEWNSGYTAEVLISNNTELEITSWTVEMDFTDGSTISRSWNTSLSGSTPYIADNASYNNKISAGSSKTFGFNVQKAVSGESVVPPVLGGICDASDNTTTSAILASANASTHSGDAPLEVTFDASESISESELVSYLWDFGDGNSSTDISPTHTFANAGSYQVVLTVKDAETEAQEQLSIQVLEAEPEFASCEYQVVNEWLSGFTAEVRISNIEPIDINGWTVELSYPDNTRISGTWDSSYTGNNPYQINNANYNSEIASGSTVSFGFNAQKGTSGSIPVTPTLAGICGESITNQRPEAILQTDITAGVVPLTVAFDATASSDPDGHSIAYLWSMDNQTLSENAAFSHTFEQAGEYEVSLKVNDGSLDSETQFVTITASEEMNFTGYSMDAASSSIHFVSTKKLHTIESHTFTTLSGDISESGVASLNIDLTSVETGNDTRDQRLQDYVFETDSFATAKVTLTVSTQELILMEVGDEITKSITANLDLHGHNIELQTNVQITKLINGSIVVRNTAPINLHTNDFSLTDGIEYIKGLANLDVISYAVPVNFTLIFNAN